MFYQAIRLAVPSFFYLVSKAHYAQILFVCLASNVRGCLLVTCPALSVRRCVACFIVKINVPSLR